MGKNLRNKIWDVVVLGGGIAGLGVARALTLKKKKVLIIEKNVRGDSSSHASGILDPFVDLDLRPKMLELTLPSLRKYPAYIRQLEQNTSVKTGYEKRDLLYLAFSKSDEEKLRRFKSLPQSRNTIRVEWLNRNAVIAKEPRISGRIRGGLCLKGVARVFPKQLLSVLRQWLHQKGVTFLKTSLDPEILIQNNSIAGIRLGSRTISTTHIVSCLGAWAGGEEKRSILREKIEPMRGQILIYPYPGSLSTLLHTANGGYLIPWNPGFLLAGSTVERAGFNPEVTAAGRKKIRNYAVKLLPELAKVSPKRVWAGLRPRSLTAQPRIGKTAVKGYYVANGYFRCGILIGIYAGELLAKAILTGKTPKALKPFLPVSKNDKDKGENA